MTDLSPKQLCGYVSVLNHKLFLPSFYCYYLYYHLYCYLLILKFFKYLIWTIMNCKHEQLPSQWCKIYLTSYRFELWSCWSKSSFQPLGHCNYSSKFLAKSMRNKRRTIVRASTKGADLQKHAQPQRFINLISKFKWFDWFYGF